MKQATASHVMPARDGVPARRFEIEVVLVSPDDVRVAVVKDGSPWCEDQTVAGALVSVGYVTASRGQIARLRAKVEECAFLAAARA